MENEELKMLRRILAEEEGKEEDILDMVWPEEIGDEEEKPEKRISSPERMEELEKENRWLRHYLLTQWERIEQLEKELPPPWITEEEERKEKENKLRGFLTGMALSWILIVLGVFLTLMGWNALKWTAEMMGLSVSLLCSFLAVLTLAVLLMGRAKRVAEWLLYRFFWLEEDER